MKKTLIILGMNKILLIILFSIISFYSTISKADNYEPLDGNIKEGDKGAVFYLLSRCSAVYFASAKVLEERDPSISKDYEDPATELLKLVATLNMDLKNLSAEESLSKSTQLIIEMTDLYIEDMNSNWIKTGSFFQDTYIAEDIITCNQTLGL